VQLRNNAHCTDKTKHDCDGSTNVQQIEYSYSFTSLWIYVPCRIADIINWVREPDSSAAPNWTDANKFLRFRAIAAEA